MLNIALILAFTMLTIAQLLNLYRLFKGPSLPDRILALDTIYINALALFLLLGIYFDSKLYFEAALIIAVMGFVGTVATSKYLMRGNIVE